MKPSWGVLFSILYCTASAAYEPSVSPETARLIIAQRLGLARFHSIEHADTPTIQHINKYGGMQPRLFGGDVEQGTRAHLLMWIDGVEEKEATVLTKDNSERWQAFTMSNPPQSSDNNRMVKDFIAQAESLPLFPDPQKDIYTQTLQIEEALPKDTVSTHNGYLSVARFSAKDTQTKAIVDRASHQATILGLTMTIVKIPASAAHSKRSANPWGTYKLPSANEARRQNPEEVLTLQAEPSSSPAPPVSDLEDFPIFTSRAKDNSPVRGILPSCFPSMSVCQMTTHNCSNHGECKLLHKARGSGKDQQSANCFGCACSPTIKKVKLGADQESKQVTYWGGPACQKQDISIQFWLFVGSGVVLAFLVASGIGMLYSMGAEELPSVIGAGVSGPQRK